MEWPAKSPGFNPINPNPNRAVLGEDGAKGLKERGVQSVPQTRCPVSVCFNRIIIIYLHFRYKE